MTRMRQDLGDHVEQLSAAGNDHGDAFLLLRADLAENSVPKDLRVSDDCGQRRSEVVRDIRKKLRLERIAITKVGDHALRVGQLEFESLQPLGELVVAAYIGGEWGISHSR